MPYKDVEKRRAYFRNNPKHLRLVKANTAKYWKENQEKLWTFLADKHCTDCPETDPLVMEFDHVRGNKRSSISRMLRHCLWSTILTEIAKCEIRCANCHRRRTVQSGNHWRWSKRRESNPNLDANLA